MTDVLDWRELAYPQEKHDCDCSYCDAQGELEPIEHPVLVRMIINGREYVTDRYLAVLAEHAPIPEDYEGVVLGPMEHEAGWATEEPLRRQARGISFRWQTIKATDLTGWQIRHLGTEKDDAPGACQFAVFAADNETHIGWAMSARERDDDTWARDHTREYGDTESED